MVRTLALLIVASLCWLPALSVAQDASVLIPEQSFDDLSAGDELSVPVNVEHSLDGTEYFFSQGSLTIEGIISFDMEITYDADVLKAVGIATEETFSEGWMTAVNAEEPGLLRISGTSSADPLQGPPAPLLYLRFEVVSHGESELDFRTMQFNNGEAFTTPGSVTIDE